MVVACAIGAGGLKVKPYGRPAADLDPASSDAPVGLVPLQDCGMLQPSNSP